MNNADPRRIESFPNGVEVYQVTADPAPVCNIYCEFPWCSPDSRWFIFSRWIEPDSLNPIEYVACELGGWRTRSLGRSSGYPTMAGGRFYFSRRIDVRRRELVRYDLDTWTEQAFPLPETVPVDRKSVV